MAAPAPPPDEDAAVSNQEEDTDEENPYAPGVNHILEAVANVLEKDKFVEAVSKWVDSRSEAPKHEKKVYGWGLLASLYAGTALFFGISLLVWKDKISHEAAGTLIGSLMGYWFGQRSKGKSE